MQSNQGEWQRVALLNYDASLRRCMVDGPQSFLHEIYVCANAVLRISRFLEILGFPPFFTFKYLISLSKLLV